MFASRAARPNATVAAGQDGERAAPASATRSPGREARGQGWDFARVPLAAPAGGGGPPSSRLAIGRTDDPLEHDADRLADQVLRMADPRSRASVAGPPGGGTSVAVVRRAPVAGGGATAGEASELFSGSGRALDAATRGFFEPRFGFSLSQVRIHADDRSARSARAIGAKAFAAGSHIGFAANQYAPASPSGRRLLAHELAHVAQAAPGAAGIVRRTPADPVKYDTGTQTFSPPAASTTLAKVKADIADKQAKTPDPDLGAKVDVKGVTAGQPEELYVWNVLLQRAERANWGTQIQVVTQIGPKPPDPPGGAAPLGQITLNIEKNGDATAELLDKGAVAVPAGFTDKAKIITALTTTDFQFAAVEDGTGAWTLEHLNKVHAALSKLSAAERTALSGAKLVRDSTLANDAGQPLDALFQSKHAFTAAAPGTPAVASRDDALRVADSAFDHDTAGFTGEKGKEVLPSLRIIIHEAGHAIETKAVRDAEAVSDTASAAVNNDTASFNTENTSTSSAVGVANADATAARAKAKAYTGTVKAGASTFLGAFNAALGAINTYANNSTGSTFASLETAATARVTARDKALAALPAGHPAGTDFAAAIASQDAWFAQAKVRAAASIKLDATKADAKTKKDALKATKDPTGAMSTRLASFVAAVKADPRVKPITQYAKDNWPAHPEEFFAEAYSLWETYPDYLDKNAPAVKAWFDAGNHLK